MKYRVQECRQNVGILMLFHKVFSKYLVMIAKKLNVQFVMNENILYNTTWLEESIYLQSIFLACFPCGD